MAVVGWGLNYGAIPAPSLRECRYRRQAAVFTSSPKFCEFWTPFKTEQINWGLSIVCRERRSSCYCSSSSAGTFLIKLLLSPEETFRRLSEWRSLHILAKWFFGFIPRAIVIVFPFYWRHGFWMCSDKLVGEFNICLRSFCYIFLFTPQWFMATSSYRIMFNFHKRAN